MSTTTGSAARGKKGNSNGSDRPYRSHLQPACLACRKRKSRCKVVAGKASCVFCDAYGTECIYPAGQRGEASPTKRRRTVTPAAPVHHKAIQPPKPPTPDVRSADAAPSTMINADGDEDNTHIVGPVEASDSRVLASYLDYLSADSTTRLRSKTKGEGPLFTGIRKRPFGYAAPRTPSAQKCEIIEKMLEPWLDEIVDLFFDRANRCFPVLGRASFLGLFRSERARISPALMAGIYAHVMTFWRPTDGKRKPDVRYVWNQATAAMYSELHMSPGISTLVAVLLNVGGRPTTSIMGNTTQMGSAISIANALGLNRDPTGWAIPAHEQRLRKRIWWGLMVHDTWCSLAYGTPLRIRRGQHDVPFPEVGDLYDNEGGDLEIEEENAGQIYVTLVSLTEILAQYLDHVYDLQEQNHDRLSRLEDRLAEWQAALRGDIRRIVLRGTILSAYPGAANLRLAFLAVQLLRQRIREEDGKAAEDIVYFVEELTADQLADFWLTTNAFTLASAATSLLRCALETRQTASSTVSASASSTSLSLVTQLMAALRRHRENSGWDVADICISQYGDIVDKLSQTQSSATPAPAPDPHPHTSFDPVLDPDLDPSLDLDMFMTNLPDVPDVDTMFPSLWDVFTNNA